MWCIIRWCMSHQYYFPLVLRPYIRKVIFSAPQIVRHVYRKSKRIAIIIIFEVTEYCTPHIICFATNWFYFLMMKYRCVFHHNLVHYTATFRLKISMVWTGPAMACVTEPPWNCLTTTIFGRYVSSSLTWTTLASDLASWFHMKKNIETLGCKISRSAE